MSRLFAGLVLMGVLALAGVLGGCASGSPGSDQAQAGAAGEGDPWEPFNRTMYKVNTELDRYTLRPAAEAYSRVVPDPVRTGIHNILTNLAYPVQLANDMLEGKPRRAGDTLVRFVVNSTVGVLGAVDVAQHLGYPDHSSDFGLTLALWGVSGSPYLFLPVLGPGNPRDSFGRIVDIAGDPFGYIGQGTGVVVARWTRLGVNLIDQRAQYLGVFSQIRRTALDPYATFRSLYRQHRSAEIESVRADHARTVPAWFPVSAEPSDHSSSN
ncbi:MAG TPA: VacJ family lipoprotein [Acetobacteraceae bacterium]|nr:VacJ family lipoprotein [Acetobacteraceae bacterium]